MNYTRNERINRTKFGAVLPSKRRTFKGEVGGRFRESLLFPPKTVRLTNRSMLRAENVHWTRFSPIIQPLVRMALISEGKEVFSPIEGKHVVA